MEIELVVLIWMLLTAGFYMLLRRSLIKVLLGLALLSQAANLVVFLGGGLTRSNPPVITDQLEAISKNYADPLPQALVLTAIVISFGVIAFTLVLFERANDAIGSDDLDVMRNTEREEE